MWNVSLASEFEWRSWSGPSTIWPPSGVLIVACMNPLPFSGSTLFVTSLPSASTSVDSFDDQSESRRPENVFSVSTALYQLELSGRLVALDDDAMNALPPVRAYSAVKRCWSLIAQSTFENTLTSDSSRLREGTPASK